MIALLALCRAATYESGTMVMLKGEPQVVNFENSAHEAVFGAYFGKTEALDFGTAEHVEAKVPSQCRRIFVSSEFDTVTRLNQRTATDSCFFFAQSQPARIEFQVVSNVSLPNQAYVESIDGKVPNMLPRGYGKWAVDIEESIVVRWSLVMPTPDFPELKIRAVQRNASLPSRGYKFWFDPKSEVVLFDANQNEAVPAPEAPPTPTITLMNYTSAWDQFMHESYFHWLLMFTDPCVITIIVTAAIIILFCWRWGAARRRTNGQHNIVLNRREAEAVPPIVAATPVNVQAMPPPPPAPAPYGYFPAPPMPQMPQMAPMPQMPQMPVYQMQPPQQFTMVRYPGCE